jgi:hypothetical protein
MLVAAFKRWQGDISQASGVNVLRLLASQPSRHSTFKLSVEGVHLPDKLSSIKLSAYADPRP